MFLKTLLSSLVVLVTIQRWYCSGAFVHYDIIVRERLNVTLKLSITKTAYENNIKSLKVSVKHQSGNILFCQVLHLNKTPSSSPGCRYDLKKREYYVTRQLKDPDGEMWELTAGLTNRKTLHQLVEIEIPETPATHTSKEEEKEDSILSTQTVITIGVGGGVFLLAVVVVSVVLCQRKVGRCCSSARLTYNPRTAQTDGCHRALSGVHSHLHFVAPEHSQETQSQDFETFHDSGTSVRQDNDDTRRCNQSDECSSGGYTDEDIYVNQEAWCA
ncbi:uncharacterized protein [Littorina saxatilis]|uniref:Uncharacterized protein n=1 Tax=Littorina saxatilis TaxID=31220 RepID=A0AAN9BHH1_9CAEN